MNLRSILWEKKDKNFLKGKFIYKKVTKEQESRKGKFYHLKSLQKNVDSSFYWRLYWVDKNFVKWLYESKNRKIKRESV